MEKMYRYKYLEPDSKRKQYYIKGRNITAGQLVRHMLANKYVYKKDDKGNVIKDENDEPVVDTDIPEIIKEFNNFKRKYSMNF